LEAVLSTPQTWQVVIQKQYGTEYYVNDYHVQADSAQAAAVQAELIVEIERAVHATTVSFINYRVKNAASSAQGTVYPIGESGLNPAGAMMPLYNTVRVDMAVEVGRPGRKYLRLPIQMAASSNGQFNSDFLNFMLDFYCLPLQNLGTVCKPNGQLFTLIRPVASVQMRQIRRGSKRRLQPII
jgi:hypothetical protein